MAYNAPPMNGINVAIGMVVRGNQLLICQRKADVALGGYWEFPGGKMEPGESAEHCVRREIKEETGIDVDPSEAWPAVEFDYDLGRVRLHPFLCRYLAGQALAIGCQSARWVLPSQLTDYRFPPANDSLIAELRRRFGA